MPPNGVDQVAGVVGVDPDRPGAQPPRDAVGGGHVAGPDRGGEPVLGRRPRGAIASSVGGLLHGEHRAEDLLARHGPPWATSSSTVGCHVACRRTRDGRARRRRPRDAPSCAPRSMCAEDSVQRLLVDQRAHHRGRVERDRRARASAATGDDASDQLLARPCGRRPGATRRGRSGPRCRRSPTRSRCAAASRSGASASTTLRALAAELERRPACRWTRPRRPGSAGRPRPSR